MYLGKYEHELRVILIKAWREQLPRDEAATQVKSILAQLENSIAKAKGRVDGIMPELCDGSITVNEAESEILLGEE